MSLTEERIRSMAIISAQLQEEGAVQRLVDMATAETKGQYGDAIYDDLGAIKLLIIAAAQMTVDSPSRPKCCVLHELGFVKNNIEIYAMYFSRFRKDRKDGGDAA